jgi:hypothetical protein
VLLLYHLLAPVGATGNVGAHAISVDISEHTVIALKIAPGESASGAAESAQPQGYATSHALGCSPLQLLVARRKPRGKEPVMSTSASLVAAIVSVTAGLCFAAGLRLVAG